MSRTPSKPRRTPKRTTQPTTQPDTHDTPTTAATPPQPDAADLDDLPPELEEEYALLVDLATNAPDGKTQRQELEHRTPVPKKCRVEFSRLATRARLIRLLLAFFGGGKIPQLMRDFDLSWADIQIGRLCDTGYGRSWEYVERSRDELLALKAQARAEAVLDGAEAGKGEAQLVKFLLERLRSGRYGDPRYLQGPTQYQGGGGVTYQITINQAASPQTSPGSGQKLCGECVDIPAEAVKTAEKIPILCPNT